MICQTLRTAAIPKLFLLAWVVILLTGCSKPDKRLSIGEAVANFRLDTITHERFYLNRHKGKVVVLVFWATWCRPCKTEMLELRSFARLPGWQDVIIAAVCTDPENSDQVKSIIKNLEITYPVLLDHESRLFRRFRLDALPTTLVIDRQQRLGFFRVGCDRVMMNQVKTKVISLGDADGS